MALILPNSKRTILLLSVFLFSCSSKNGGVKSSPKSSQVKVPVKKVKRPVDFGPSKKENTLFRDIAAEVGLAKEAATNLYAVDLNNDFYTDLVFLPNYYSTPQFYKYDKAGKKFIKYKKFPFKEYLKGHYLSFFDFDKDGVKDVLVGTLNQKTELTKQPLRFFKGKIRKGEIFFTEVKNAIKQSIDPSASVVFLDYNLDGYLDFFQANWYEYKNNKTIPKVDKIFLGKGLKFKEVSYLLDKENKFNKDLEIFENATPSFGASICDLDQNGYPDILVSAQSGYKNKLWMNLYDNKNKDRIFRDLGDSSGFAQDKEGALINEGGGHSFYSACIDYNNDTTMDVVTGELTRAFDNESRDRSSLLSGAQRGFPPEFIRSEYINDDIGGQWNQGDRRGIWGDYNMDGFVDLIVDNSGFPPDSRLVVFKQFPDHSFDEESVLSGMDFVNPAGSIFFDFNRDGRLDVLTGQSKVRNQKIKGYLRVYKNEIERKGNRSIRVFLRGRTSNLEGIGSMVKVSTDQNERRQYVSYSYGPFPSQNEEGVYFGLGKEKLKSIKVTWPTLKNGRVLKKSYNLKNAKFSEHLDLTLCENGKYHYGRKRCH